MSIKNLIEIDCNSSDWSSITGDLNNNWGQLENQLFFAFKTKDKKLTEDDIEVELHEVFPRLDQSEVEKIKDDDLDDDYIYFVVSVIIYVSGIAETEE